MGAGHDHGTGEISDERPLWWAFRYTLAEKLEHDFVFITSRCEWSAPDVTTNIGTLETCPRCRACVKCPRQAPSPRVIPFRWGALRATLGPDLSRNCLRVAGRPG